MRRAAAAALACTALAAAGCGSDSDPATDTGGLPVSVGDDPTEIVGGSVPPPSPGRTVVAQTGCLACHRIGGNGNPGPGQDLTQVGSRLSSAEIRRAVLVGPGIMPSYDGLEPRKVEDLVNFLASLN